MFFDIGASELLVIVVVAIIVIGPKDMPRALRTAGRWIGKIRRTAGHFRAGVDAMVREAEMEEMEKVWKDQNAAIMREHPPEMIPPPPKPEQPRTAEEQAALDEQSAKAASAEAALERGDGPAGEPELPLDDKKRD